MPKESAVGNAGTTHATFHGIRQLTLNRLALDCSDQDGEPQLSGGTIRHLRLDGTLTTSTE